MKKILRGTIKCRYTPAFNGPDFYILVKQNVYKKVLGSHIPVITSIGLGPSHAYSVSFKEPQYLVNNLFYFPTCI